TTFGVKGTTIDSVSKAKLNTSISVLNAKDSVLQKFTYSNENGAFAVSGLPAGKYFLLITYPQYEDKIRPFTLGGAQPVVDIGNINMNFVGNQLAEVKIKGPVQEIKIKGDTLEFNAKAYVVQPNAKVEDLLKQIPGIQIDKNGKITMNGEAVPKVLVDGEEFFGDDPTLVTQNLRADMVSSVQIYDKKSDQAAFTGIDDGQKTKTINVKLKEDKKRGYFGKVMGGVGTDDYYESQLIYNKFTAKNKFSVYGTMATDGKVGLGLADNTKIGASSNNVQISDGGGVVIISSGDDDLDSFDGNYNGNGLPVARAGGAHYDGKIKKDATLNVNYKIGSLEVTGNQNIFNQITIPGTQQDRTTNRTFDNYQFRQKADVTYQTKLDTSSNLKLGADYTAKHQTLASSAITTIVGETGNLLSRETKRTNGDIEQKAFNISALYTKKFKKPNRTFSWNVSESYTENDTKAYLYDDIYSPAKTPTDSITDQYKPITARSSSFNSNMTYSEPLAKYFAVQFNYGLGILNGTSDKPSFDKSGTGKYDVFNSTYSNNFKVDQLTNQFGGVFNYKKGKVLINFGARASVVDLDQVERYNGRSFKRSFVNWSPQARYQYQPSSTKVIYFNYSGYMTQPNMDQLQPVPVNTNPLDIVIGNPDLKASFSHSFTAIYQTQQIISRQSFSVNGNFNFTENPIASRTTIDPASGKTVTQSVNITGNTPFNYSVGANIRRRITGTEIDAGINASTSGSVGFGYINGALNQTTQNSYNVGLQMQTAKVKKYELGFRVGPSYSFNRYSVTPNQNNNAAGANVNARGVLYLPGKFILSSDVNYNHSGKTQSIDAIDITNLNASLSKTFLKEDNLKLSLLGNNLLNANPTLNRRVTTTGITQNSYNTILRYFMFSVTWDFTKFGTTAAKN
ncbi:MAG: outer membrane beta-barrel protein, partial [Mucilaginibacter sp.]